MSVFFTGKNIENLKRDVFTAAEYNVKHLRKIKLNRETEAEIDMIRQKLKSGEWSVEECRRQFRLVMRQYKWRVKAIENWSLMDTLSRRANRKAEFPLRGFSPFSPRRGA